MASSVAQTLSEDDASSMADGDSVQSSRLDGLKEAVEGLIPVYDDLTREQKERRKFDEERVLEQMARAREVLKREEAEEVQRMETDLALDKVAQTAIRNMQIKVTAPIETGLKEVEDQLTAANKRLAEAEASLLRNVAQNEKDLKELRVSVVEKLEMFKKSLAHQVAVRQEEDERIRALFPSMFENVRLTMLREQEVMEDEAHALRVRCRALETSEASLEAMAQRQIREETKQFAESLTKEKEERVAGLHRVNVTVSEYNTALAHSLRIVNRSDV